MDIGKKLRELRKQNDLTLEDLASRSELTKGFLSQVERNLTAPSIATLEDILEELVGEIWDEHDEEETPITKVPDGTYLVDAEMSFDDFAEYFGLKSDSDMASVSGWVMEQCDRVPEVGDHFTCQGLRVQVTRVDNHRTGEIRVTVEQKLEEPMQEN